MNRICAVCGKTLENRPGEAMVLLHFPSYEIVLAVHSQPCYDLAIERIAVFVRQLVANKSEGGPT